MVLPIDIQQNTSLSLSEIADEITVVELELTDESRINPDRVRRVLLYDDQIIVASKDNILVFNIKGKFIRCIGSIGQGLGAYVEGSIGNVVLDEKNKRLFVYTVPKIICYDLDGNFLYESIMPRMSMCYKANMSYVSDMNYVNDELLLIVENLWIMDENGLFNHSGLYRLNSDLQITDSCTIRKTYYDRPVMTYHTYEDYIIFRDSTIYIYYPDSFVGDPAETLLRDTLYRLENNQLIPIAKLKFKNDGIDNLKDRYINICNIYRSARYVFAVYRTWLVNSDYHYFCYDTKTGKGYHMKDGYTDDINRLEAPVGFRPFNTNPERFYYWHTRQVPVGIDTPNPTLFIGKLKQ